MNRILIEQFSKNVVEFFTYHAFVVGMCSCTHVEFLGVRLEGFFVNESIY